MKLNKEIQYCIIKCKGLEQDCNKYQKIDDSGVCGWYSASLLEEQLNTKNKQEKSKLEYKIKDDISKFYDSKSAIFWDTRKKALYKAGKIIGDYDELPVQWKEFKNVYEI